MSKSTKIKENNEDEKLGSAKEDRPLSNASEKRLKNEEDYMPPTKRSRPLYEDEDSNDECPLDLTVRKRKTKKNQRPNIEQETNLAVLPYFSRLSKSYIVTTRAGVEYSIKPEGILLDMDACIVPTRKQRRKCVIDGLLLNQVPISELPEEAIECLLDRLIDMLRKRKRRMKSKSTTSTGEATSATPSGLTPKMVRSKPANARSSAVTVDSSEDSV